VSKENEQYKAALEAGDQSPLIFATDLCLQGIEKMKTQLLNSDLDKRVLELGRERHHSEQYQNQLNGQAAAHKEVVEQLTKYHTGIMDELTKEDGILARILSSESATQAKLVQSSRN
jgi:hypothetical protein